MKSSKCIQYARTVYTHTLTFKCLGSVRFDKIDQNWQDSKNFYINQSFAKYIMQPIFIIDNNTKWYFTKSAFLEWFLKDRVTLKTNGCWEFGFAIIGINYILKYIKTESWYFKCYWLVLGND